MIFVKTYIEQHLSEPFDIATLCKELSIGRTKLHEIFKAETNMGIAEYLRKRRIHKAKKLLKLQIYPRQKSLRLLDFQIITTLARFLKKFMESLLGIIGHSKYLSALLNNI